MKRMSFLPMGAVALLLAFTACSEDLIEVPSSTLKQIVMTATDFETEDESRTNFQITSAGAEFSWAANDTVGIFPNEGAQAYFPMTSGAGTKSANFTGGGWALKDASTYAAYYPFIGDFYLNKNAIPVDFSGQVQTGDASTAHLGAYDYMAAIPATPKNGNVSFAFKHLGALVQLKLTVPQATTLNSVTLTIENDAFAVKGTVDVMASAPSITSVTSTKEVTLELKKLATTEANQVVTLYMMLPPVDLSAKNLKAVVKTSTGIEEVALESKNFQAGKAYALSGSLKDLNGGAVVGNGTYKDGVVSIATAGTMMKLLGDDYLNITSLKVVGPINGDDVYYLRKMLGARSFNEADWGKLTTLDLSEATIVEGGDYYYCGDYRGCYYTVNNTIGDFMFYDCDVLQNIILPNNVLSIGEYAFSNCSALVDVTISNIVNEIRRFAFQECDKLVTIVIEGSGSTTLESSIFNSCDALTSVKIGDGVVKIGSFLFNGCSRLEEVTFGNKILIIPDGIFNYCDSLKKITIGSGVKTIEYAIAYYWSAKDIEVYISDLKAWCNIDCTTGPMTNGGGKLYLNNKLLTEVTIPDGVTNVGSAFEGCASITKVTIPEGVVSVGSFRHCTSLTNIQISNSVESLSEFDYCTSLTNITIPNSVTSIYTMRYCTALTEVKLGNGITSIRDEMFSGCNSLKKVTIGDNVEKIGKLAFENNAIEEFYSYSKEPPSIMIGEFRDYSGDWYDGTSFLDGIKEEAILYIPSRSSDKYQSSQWSEEFKNIREM